jgi:2,5-diamino-6-(ribosylamino)-4(3H)-pyrimidinone 5'-phosphate reductase
MVAGAAADDLQEPREAGMERYFDGTVRGAQPGTVDREQVYARLAFPEGVDRPTRRPYTVINMVSTVDGKAVVGGPGTSDSIGSATDHGLLERIAAQVDAVLWGANTVRDDDPPYPRLGDGERRRRAALGLRPDPLWVVVSATGEFARPPRAFRGGPANVVLFVSDRSPPAHRDALGERAQVFVFPDGRFDPRSAGRVLRDRFGVRRVNCLGGPRLNAALLQAGVVDELFLTLAPKLQGGRRMPTVLGPCDPLDALAPPPRLRLLSLYGEGSELYLRYRVQERRPAKGRAG